MSFLLPIISGILLALSFPKFGLFPLAWIALVPLFIDIRDRKDPADAARAGFVFGLIFFGFNLFWINTLNRFAPGFAALGYVCLIAGESAFIAAACFTLKYVSKNFPSLNILTYPLIWTFFEWLRTIGPFGISAGDIGYSQAPFLPLIQIASFATVFGVTSLIVMVNALIAEIIGSGRKRAAIYLFIAILLPFFSYLWGNSQMSVPVKGSRTVKVMVIQGNIPQEQKLATRYNNDIFAIHEELTRGATGEKPDLVIWPESVVLSYLADNALLFPRVQKLARDTKAYLLIGTPFYTAKSDTYNSIICVSPSGEITGRYDKQRIVPFGEYLPFRALLFPLLKATGFFYNDFDFGRKDAQILNAGGIKIGVAICFESTFIDLMSDRSKKGSDLLLTVTNDAWFGNSSAPYDHFDCGVFRAIENRKWFIQCANTGISAMIDPYGRIIKKAGVGERTALTFEVPLP